MLDMYEFNFGLEFEGMTVEIPISFNLILAEDSDVGLLEEARDALMQFIVANMKSGGNDALN